MTSRLDELIDALPDDLEPPAVAAGSPLGPLLDARDAGRPIPTGRFQRLWTLGTLQGRIAAAYFAGWVRGFHAEEDERQRRRNETHLKSALLLFGSMGYLRGAVMKLGQIMAHYPEVLPVEFADVLGRLYFQAPPMHFSLLRELVRGELGADPEEIFDAFESNAFAAASLGQVHRARLKETGQAVAVKIQYPDIARAIRDDCRNMRAVITPMRLSGDWSNLETQFDDIRRMLELELDYEAEAAHQEQARAAFREEDEVVVPRVFADHSTHRVLTMEYVEGVHLEAFLRSDPSQELRDHHGRQICLATYRLSYGAHLLYADMHPGNFLFMPDGRLGLLDFGCCHRYSDEDVDYLTQAERAAQGSPEAVREVLVRAADLTPRQQRDEQRMHLMKAWCDWVWEPMFLRDGPFDFGNPEYFRRGWQIYCELVKRRYVRSLPINTWLTKNFFGLRALLHRLRARVDLGAIVRQETTVA